LRQAAVNGLLAVRHLLLRGAHFPAACSAVLATSCTA
jgi:hypothetical protein